MRNALIQTLLPLSVLFAGGLKSPAEFLGYELGAHFTYHHRVVSYYEHVADVASNVKIIPYGKQNITQDDINAVVEVLIFNYLTYE